MALPDPVTRKEQYLYAIATNGGGGGGADDYEKLANSMAIPDAPLTREEQYLDAIVKNGGGGGGSVTLYDTTGQNTDGAMTQRAVTDALPEVISLSGSTVDADTLAKLVENPNKYAIKYGGYTYYFSGEYNNSLHYAAFSKPGVTDGGIQSIAIAKDGGILSFSSYVSIKFGTVNATSFDGLLTAILSDMASDSPSGHVTAEILYHYYSGVGALSVNAGYLCYCLNMPGSSTGIVVEYINKSDGTRIVAYSSASNRFNYIVYPAYANGNEVGY